MEHKKDEDIDSRSQWFEWEGSSTRLIIWPSLINPLPYTQRSCGTIVLDGCCRGKTWSLGPDLVSARRAHSRWVIWMDSKEERHRQMERIFLEKRWIYRVNRALTNKQSHAQRKMPTWVSGHDKRREAPRKWEYRIWMTHYPLTVNSRDRIMS